MDYVKMLRDALGPRPINLTGAVVAVFDEKNRILLQKKHDGSWAIPGGLMELGEAVEDTARREVFEETGIEVGQLTLLHVFSGEKYFVELANGDQFYAVTVAFMSRDIVGGALTADGIETVEANFFPLTELPERTSPILKSLLKRFPDIAKAD
ncbi:MAG: NUDIX hydrolase [Bacillus sp. (in: firmicutes)]